MKFQPVPQSPEKTEKPPPAPAPDWPTAFAAPAFRAFAERTARMDEAERLAEREN